MRKSTSRISSFSLHYMTIAGLTMLLTGCQGAPTTSPRAATLPATDDLVNGASSANDTPKTRATPEGSLADGTILYAKYCETCHGALDVSAKIGADAKTIATAIASVVEMRGLQGVSAQQREAIATALASVQKAPTVDKPTPPPPVEDADDDDDKADDDDAGSDD